MAEIDEKKGEQRRERTLKSLSSSSPAASPPTTTAIPLLPSSSVPAAVSPLTSLPRTGQTDLLSSSRRKKRTSRRGGWRGLILLKEKLHVEAIPISLPRFHLLGAVWAVVELAVFLLALVQMDYSFEFLDTPTQLLKSWTDQQTFLTEKEERVFDMKRDSIVSLTQGTRQGGDNCGPQPGTPYYNYLNAQALYGLVTKNGPIAGFTTSTIEEKRETGEGREGREREGEEAIEQLDRQYLAMILCNRTEPLFDQRFVLSALSQPCKGLELFTNVSKSLSLCTDPEAHVFQLLVSGIGNVCVFGFSREDPLGVATTPCVRFGKRDLERRELRWVVRRLERVWKLMKASALSWIFLSLLMRIIYWVKVIEITRRSVTHLRTECTGSIQQSDSSLPLSSPCGPSLSHPIEEKEKMQTVSSAVASASSLPRGKEQEGKQHTILLAKTVPSSFLSSPPLDPGRSPGLPSPMNLSSSSQVALPRRRGAGKGPCISLPDLSDVATAASIGIACANNDTVYLLLGVLRQLVGASYGEITTAAAMTAPLAAWQACGIVVYHEAVIMMLFHGLRLLDRREKRERRKWGAVASITDVGVLGYVSLLLICSTAQSARLLKIDLLWIVRLSNWIISWLWWLLLPSSGPEGVGLWIRGDIVFHTVSAVEASLFALFLQMAVHLMTKRKRKARPEEREIPLSDEDHYCSSGGAEQRMKGGETTEEVVIAARWWFYLGTVGCPRCGALIVKQWSAATVGGEEGQGEVAAEEERVRQKKKTNSNGRICPSSSSSSGVPTLRPPAAKKHQGPAEEKKGEAAQTNQRKEEEEAIAFSHYHFLTLSSQKPYGS